MSKEGFLALALGYACDTLERAVTRVVTALPFRSGTLSFFAGRYSLHRVTAVMESRDRLVAVQVFSITKGYCNSACRPDQAVVSDLYATCSIPTSRVDILLVKAAPYNHDTSLFTFGLPGEGRGCWDSRRAHACWPWPPARTTTGWMQ